jgi:hypothetical protein
MVLFRVQRFLKDIADQVSGDSAVGDDTVFIVVVDNPASVFEPH